MRKNIILILLFTVFLSSCENSSNETNTPNQFKFSAATKIEEEKPPEEEPENKIKWRNNSGFDIYAVYITNQGNKDWGSDILGDKIFISDSSINLPGLKPEKKFYDILCENEFGDHFIWRDIDFSHLTEIDLYIDENYIPRANLKNNYESINFSGDNIYETDKFIIPVPDGWEYVEKENAFLSSDNEGKLHIFHKGGKYSIMDKANKVSSFSVPVSTEYIYSENTGYFSLNTFDLDGIITYYYFLDNEETPLALIYILPKQMVEKTSPGLIDEYVTYIKIKTPPPEEVENIEENTESEQ